MQHTVLYIDDDAGLRKLVERGLTREGVRVVCAASGEDGIKALTTEEFDAIALDQYMPGLDGLATLERIRVTQSHPPVIFVTGAQDSRIAVAALKAGAFDYVIKDVQGEFIPLLLAAIQAAIHAMHMRRDKEAAEKEVREARDRFEALATERQMLMREVNHRVGNSLQLIASLLTLQSNAATSVDVKNALGDVDVAAEVVAALDFDGVVGGRQNDNRHTLEMLVGLDARENVDARHVREVEVEQHQHRPVLVHASGAVRAEQIFGGVGAVRERRDAVIDAGAADVFLDQPRMALIVLDHDDLDRKFRYLAVHAALLLSCVHRRGSVTVN
jgi:DNA-binding response OmpR family regulator